ncbi:hypothetical protein COO60DRAFT_572888 [Scenedesmus sp. NREL 46B-D3]|nr:hypothetical protein COO60DRAFT_572888 [Scenedesmus sp. NREL 46B-D3]
MVKTRARGCCSLLSMFACFGVHGNHTNSAYISLCSSAQLVDRDVGMSCSVALQACHNSKRCCNRMLQFVCVHTLWVPAVMLSGWASCAWFTARSSPAFSLR